MSVWILAVLIFILAVVMTMTGRGGGNFYVLALVISGVTMHQAASTGQFILVCSSLAATVLFGKRKIVDWKLFAFIGSITLIFAFLGGFCSSKFDAKILKIVFAVFVFFASLLMLRPVKSGYVKSRWGLEIKSATGSYYINLLFFVPIVMVTGFVSGMVGISGGSFLVPLMVLTIGVPMQIAVGTSTALVMITASAGFLGHLSIGHFDIKSSLILAFCAVIGSIIGTRLTIKANAKVLKYIFAFTSMIAAIIMLLI